MPFSNVSRRELMRIFGGMTGALLLPDTAFAAQHDAKLLASPVPAFDNDPIKITPLTKTLSLIQGPGGNIVLLTGADGPLIIDTGVPVRGKDLVKAANGAAHHPVTTVINTHFHFDHTGGNEAFGKSKAHIIAHENTRERMSTAQTIELINFTVPASPAIALPALTFTDALTLHRNGETIHLIHVAPAHTDSDIIVHFPQSNVIHAGDLFFNGVYPIIDFSSKGWIGGMIAGIDRVIALADDSTKIVPGHGPLGNKAQITALREMLASVQAKIEPMVKDGKSVEEIVAAKPTTDYDAQWGKGLLNADTFVKMVVLGIQRHNAA